MCSSVGTRYACTYAQRAVEPDPNPATARASEPWELIAQHASRTTGGIGEGRQASLGLTASYRDWFGRPSAAGGGCWCVPALVLVLVGRGR